MNTQQDLTSYTGQTDEIAVHDGTGSLPSGTVCRFDGSNWVVLQPVSIQYTGDGTQSRTLLGSFQFEFALVTEAGADNAEDAYEGNIPDGTLAGNTFAGELTVESNGGITVGDNGADADPNTNNETYDLFAK